jgi:WD40 repeat protein
MGGEVQVWDAVTGEELLPTPPAYLSAAMDPLGEWVALGTSARTIECRNLASGAVQRTIPLDLFPGSIAVSLDRLILAVAPEQTHGSSGRILILSEDRTLHELNDLTIPQSPVFTPDGSLLLACDWEHFAAWSTDGFRLKFKVPLPKSVRGYSRAQLAVTSDSSKVAVSAWDDSFGGLVIFRLPEGRQLFANPFGSTTAITATPDPRMIVINLGRQIRRFDVEKGKLEGSVQVFPDLNAYAVSLACSPDGARLASTSSDGQLATLITGFLGPDRSLTLGHPTFVAERVLYTPDGRHVVTVNSNGTVYIVRLQAWSAPSDSDRN